MPGRTPTTSSTGASAARGGVLMSAGQSTSPRASSATSSALALPDGAGFGAVRRRPGPAPDESSFLAPQAVRATAASTTGNHWYSFMTDFPHFFLKMFLRSSTAFLRSGRRGGSAGGDGGHVAAQVGEVQAVLPARAHLLARQDLQLVHDHVVGPGGAQLLAAGIEAGHGEGGVPGFARIQHEGRIRRPGSHQADAGEAGVVGAGTAIDVAVAQVVDGRAAAGLVAQDDRLGADVAERSG